MPGRPEGVIAVRKKARKMKDTLTDVLCPIIRKEDGFLKVVGTVQLSHKCYLYRIYDTFRVALTYRSKNI